MSCTEATAEICTKMFDYFHFANSCSCTQPEPKILNNGTIFLQIYAPRHPGPTLSFSIQTVMKRSGILPPPPSLQPPPARTTHTAIFRFVWCGSGSISVLALLLIGGPQKEQWYGWVKCHPEFTTPPPLPSPGFGYDLKTRREVGGSGLSGRICPGECGNGTQPQTLFPPTPTRFACAGGCKEKGGGGCGERRIGKKRKHVSDTCTNISLGMYIGMWCLVSRNTRLANGKVRFAIR